MKMYMDFQGERNDANELIAALLNGAINPSTSSINTAVLEYTVVYYPCFDLQQAKEFDGGFFITNITLKLSQLSKFRDKGATL